MQSHSPLLPEKDPLENSVLNHELPDPLGRQIDYIRLSVTDRCNFRCVYCMPPEGVPSIPHTEILSFEEFLRFCRISAGLGISRYKITGGEPLCRKGVLSFIGSLKALHGVEQVTLTTNAVLLETALEKLGQAAQSCLPDCINVSLDTLSPRLFSEITRSTTPVEAVTSAIIRARSLGFPVKINVVPGAGQGPEDIISLTRFALDHDVHIRFIEIMPIGDSKDHRGLSQEAIYNALSGHFGPLAPLSPDLPPLGNGPAVYHAVQGHTARVGFISAVSHKFCSTCNRIRLTSQGFLKTCLQHEHGVSIKPLLRNNASDDDIRQAIITAVRNKPVGHTFADISRKGTSFYMSNIGG